MIEVRLSEDGRSMTPDQLIIGASGDNKAEVIRFIFPDSISTQIPDPRTFSLSITVTRGVNYYKDLVIGDDNTADFTIPREITIKGNHNYALELTDGDIVHGTWNGVMTVNSHVSKDTIIEGTEPSVLETVLNKVIDERGITPGIGVDSYEGLRNLPKINGVTLVGNRDLPEHPLSNLDILNLLS